MKFKNNKRFLFYPSLDSLEEGVGVSNGEEETMGIFSVFSTVVLKLSQ
jgi:hypothetical protein